MGLDYPKVSVTGLVTGFKGKGKKKVCIRVV